MKSKATPTRKKKQISIQMWVGLIVSFFSIMICIGIGFYILLTQSTNNLQTPPPINTESPTVTLETATSVSNSLLVVTSSVTPLPPPTIAPTWTPEPTFTPFVLTALQASNSVCSWMENIEGEWVSDLWGQIVTFYPNGEYVQLDKKLVDFANTMSLRGKYECTTEGYIRLLLNDEEIFETSIIKVNIVGESMKWTLVDDDDSNGHGHDITFSFTKNK